MSHASTAGSSAASGHAGASRRNLWYYIWPSHITGIAGAVIGFVVAYNIMAAAVGTEDNFGDQALLVGFLGLTIGWLAGVGTFTLPIQWLLGMAEPNSHHEQERLTYAEDGWWRY